MKHTLLLPLSTEPESQVRSSPRSHCSPVRPHHTQPVAPQSLLSGTSLLSVTMFASFTRKGKKAREGKQLCAEITRLEAKLAQRVDFETLEELVDVYSVRCS